MAAAVPTRAATAVAEWRRSQSCRPRTCGSSTIPPRSSFLTGTRARGISVVAALCEWLVHVNRRADGAWTQRHEHGIPVTGLVPVPGTGTTGTAVHFRPAAPVRLLGPQGIPDAPRLAAAWAELRIEIIRE
jgi:DNA gyrase subunit B